MILTTVLKTSTQVSSGHHWIQTPLFLMIRSECSGQSVLLHSSDLRWILPSRTASSGRWSGSKLSQPNGLPPRYTRFSPLHNLPSGLIFCSKWDSWKLSFWKFQPSTVWNSRLNGITRIFFITHFKWWITLLRKRKRRTSALLLLFMILVSRKPVAWIKREGGHSMATMQLGSIWWTKWRSG